MVGKLLEIFSKIAHYFSFGEEMANTIPAIILAAGASKRLGKAKALIEVSGSTLLKHSVSKLTKSECDPIVVVVNREIHFDAVVQSSGATVVLNKNPDNGRTGSLKCGIMSIAKDLGRMPEKIIMCPVDRPGWKVSHIEALVMSEISSCLSYEGLNGHPISLVKDDLLSILAAADDEPLNKLVKFQPVQVTNALLEINIDTEEDLEKLFENESFFDKL